MAKRKRKKEPITKLFLTLIKFIPIMIIAVGVCFGALIESGFITIEDVSGRLDTKVFDNSAQTLPENARSFAVHTIDVGQGDCILIEAGEKNILIDSGENENADQAVDFIKNRNISKLDYIIATHPHSDHIGGMAEIINTFETDRIIVSKLPDELVPATGTYEDFLKAVKNNNRKLTAAKAGSAYDICTIDGAAVTMKILSPHENAEFDDLNDYSVCVRIDYGSISWLFTGDMEEPSEKALLESGADIDVTALKVGHHGSSGSSCEEFLEAVSPQMCVISCGKDNSYGHPHAKALNRLKLYTESIFRTDKSGTISVYSDGIKLYITVERSS